MPSVDQDPRFGVEVKDNWDGQAQRYDDDDDFSGDYEDGQPLPGIDSVYTFVRPSTESSTKTDHICRKVQIVASKVAPMQCVLGFHSSALFHNIFGINK